MYMCVWKFLKSELTTTFTIYNDYGADPMFCMSYVTLDLMYICVWNFLESELTKIFSMYNDYWADQMVNMSPLILCICV